MINRALIRDVDHHVCFACTAVRSAPVVGFHARGVSNVTYAPTIAKRALQTQ